jgi:ABC-type multidrug transport system permease subunit
MSIIALNKSSWVDTQVFIGFLLPSRSFFVFSVVPDEFEVSIHGLYSLSHQKVSQFKFVIFCQFALSVLNFSIFSFCCL